MKCSLVDRFKWCKDLEVLDKTDEYDNKYCIFHAPAKVKGISVKEYHQVISNRFIESHIKNVLCDFSGTIFTGNIEFRKLFSITINIPIDFSDSVFLGNIDFSNVNFHHNVIFRQTKFVGKVSFRNCIFNTNKMIDFSNCEFRKEVTFKNSKFVGGVSLLNVYFDQSCDFSNAILNGARVINSDFKSEVKFTKTIFLSSGNTNFSRSKFSSKTDFDSCQFGSSAIFNRVVFDGDINFEESIFERKSSFYLSTFKGPSLFNRCRFFRKSIFQKAQFDSNAFFKNLQCKSILDFSECILYNADFSYTKTISSNFSNSSIRGLILFSGDTFTQTANFRNMRITGNIKFDGVNLVESEFLDTDLRKIDFINCKFPTKHNRQVLYDEIILDDSKEISKIKKLELSYRYFKQKNKIESDEVSASNWHYGEKEMFRKSKSIRRYNPVSLSNLYWISSGYGERPARAGIVLLAIFLFFFTSIITAGLQKVNYVDNQNVPNKITWLEMSDPNVAFTVLITTLQYITFSRDIDYLPYNNFGRLIIIIIHLIFPLQFALLALAIKNRFRR